MVGQVAAVGSEGGTGELSTGSGEHGTRSDGSRAAGSFRGIRLAGGGLRSCTDVRLSTRSEFEEAARLGGCLYRWPWLEIWTEVVSLFTSVLYRRLYLFVCCCTLDVEDVLCR